MTADAAVTVVIAVWDRYCELLEGCVSSVLTQAGGAPHIIVVDNASAVPLPPLPAAVEVIRTPRRLSAGAARNLGLQHVHTPLVLFLDADDRLLPDAVAGLSALLAERQSAVAAIGKHLLWNPDTGAETVVDRAPRPVVYRLARGRRLLALLTLRYDCFPLVGCGLLRTDAVRDAGGFGDTNLAEDWILRSGLTLRGKVAFCRAAVVRVRVQDGSLWHREHSRAELDRMFEAFIASRRADARMPWWGRLALPALSAAHRRDARRMTHDGPFVPAGHGLLGPAPATPAPGSGELSAVVCTHERPDHLARCLDGLASCAPGIEVVVVDSGSRVPCEALVAGYRDRIPNITYRYVAEPGLSLARNAGIEASRGDLVAFLDDDATVQPGWDRALARAFAEHPEVGCVGGACHPRFEGPRPRWLSDRLLTLSSITRFGERPREPRSSAEWPFGANMAFRRRALADTGGFAPELGRRGKQLLSGEDSEMVQRVLDAGWHVWLEPQAAVLHAVHRERLQSHFYWQRLWWAGIGRARRARAVTTMRLSVAVPVRLCLWALTRDRLYLYRLAESAGYFAARLGFAGRAGAGG